MHKLNHENPMQDHGKLHSVSCIEVCPLRPGVKSEPGRVALTNHNVNTLHLHKKPFRLIAEGKQLMKRLVFALCIKLSGVMTTDLEIALRLQVRDVYSGPGKKKTGFVAQMQDLGVYYSRFDQMYYLRLDITCPVRSRSVKLSTSRRLGEVKVL